MGFLYWLVDNAVAALPLALLALLLERPLRARPAVLHALWCVVLLRLVLPPLANASESEAAPAFLTTTTELVQHGPLQRWMLWMTRTFGGNWSPWVLGLVLGLFGLVVLRRLLREVRQTRAATELVERAAPASPELVGIARRVGERLGLGPVEVLSSDDVPAPFVWALGRPRLVLPKGLAATSIEPLVAHELAHLRRRDPWCAWLEIAGALLQFWNPLFHLARARRRAWAERTCDAWASALYPGQRRSFAEALLNAAGAPASPALSGHSTSALGSSARELRTRLRRLFEGTGSPVGGGLAFALALPLVALSPALIPRASEWLPSYPRVLSADSILHSQGVATWEEMARQARERIERDAEDHAALRLLGMALLGTGENEQAARTFELREQAVGPGKPSYNAACAWSLAGDFEAARAALDRAHATGEIPAGAAEADPDLSGLRASAFWYQAP